MLHSHLSSRHGRTVVVTGGTSGFGRIAVKDLLAEDLMLQVVLGARRPDEPDLIRPLPAELRSRVHVLPLDLASLTSVRQFVEHLESLRVPEVFGVVANAGVQFADRSRVTADGYEATFGVNVLGHFALLAGLRATERPLRIVLTASGTHHDQLRYRLGFPRPQWRSPEALLAPAAGPTSRRDGAVAYSTSKLGVVYLAHELARRQRNGSTVTYDPGLVPGTALARDLSPLARHLFRYVAPVGRLLPTVTSPASAGANLARLLDDSVEGPYVALGRTTRSSRESYDAEREQELWVALDHVVAEAWGPAASTR